MFLRESNKISGWEGGHALSTREWASLSYSLWDESRICRKGERKCTFVGHLDANDGGSDDNV